MSCIEQVAHRLLKDDEKRRKKKEIEKKEKERESVSIAH